MHLREFRAALSHPRPVAAVSGDPRALRPRHDPELVEKVKAWMVQSGSSYKLAAREFGLSPDTVREWSRALRRGGQGVTLGGGSGRPVDGKGRGGGGNTQHPPAPTVARATPPGGFIRATVRAPEELHRVDLDEDVDGLSARALVERAIRIRLEALGSLDSVKTHTQQATTQALVVLMTKREELIAIDGPPAAVAHDLTTFEGREAMIAELTALPMDILLEAVERKRRRQK